ncbi:hypothetical protein HWQ46_25960 [Shewanella sp. D64]|uniref:hypothetical protein n=1 Tax=unclassified Shewanella TaxID=196818 RepID=UPI0022BA4998|nr:MULTISPECIES: hypothetical protein [unclassified Shewanella]MEC4728963.1 hypothetical protein [Shewanella sp. D64]MEC4740806.1 hypothetical protein [Shewanella sp. E94]WBJ96688.1 hypothetical protein HWQ47_06110 [Shewanella sp. MTB7]
MAICWRKFASNLVFVLFITLFAYNVFAGQVVVRKSSEPFDAFAVRDQVLLDHEWKQALRMQQQIQILQVLPAACIPFSRPYIYYLCNGLSYRPYHYKNKELYIKVDEVNQPPMLRGKVE